MTEVPDWDALVAAHPPSLVERLKRHFVGGGHFEISALELSMETSATTEQAAVLLDAVVAGAGLTRSTRWRCPCEERCRLSPTDLESGCCPRTGQAFGSDIAGTPTEEAIYARDAPQTRDVRWVLALHGMNTRGGWQEDFAWMLSRAYGRSVPVAIYKYGIVRPGAVLRFRQRRLTTDLQERLHRLSGETDNTGFGGTPDVIAHSFGTWLLGHALQADPTLKVGRVILTGCILRPDFGWGELIRRGQVLGVLCHYASRDFWARFAQYLIPDAGPSGRIGFNERQDIVHRQLQGGRHSDFFAADKLRELFEDVWQPFLVAPTAAPSHNSSPSLAWKEAAWPFRARLWRWLILLCAGGLGLLAAVSFLLGLRQVLSFACAS